MKIFVSGCGGFLGGHICHALIAQGHDVWGIDSLIGGDEENIPKGMYWIKGDCRNLGLIPNTDVVIHAAAIACEGLSVFSPALITESVYGASVNVFSAAISSGVRRIVYLSSMARYGEGLPPFKENDRCKPSDPYGISKFAAEQTLRCLAEAHGIEYAIAVPHSVIGPRQKRDDPYRNVIAIWLNQILLGRAPTIYGDGKQSRCFSDIADVLPCLVKMATEDACLGEVVNIGPDEEIVSINDVCQMVMEVMGVEGAPVHYPGRPNEVMHAFCSSDKARKLLGYKTKTRLYQGLIKMAKWAKEVGPLPFQYHLPIEIQSKRLPRTWSNREI